MNYNGSKEKALDVVSCIEQNGGKAVAIQGSVNEFEDCGRMINEALDQFGKIDIIDRLLPIEFIIKQEGKQKTIIIKEI